MALGNRLVQNIDLTASADGLLRLLQALGKDASKFAETLANAGGDTKGISKTSRQLGVVLKQAQLLQNVLDAIGSKRSAGLMSDIEVQRLGKAVGQVGKLRQEINQVSTASGVLDKRLADVNKRFAEMGKGGRTPGNRDLSKQLKLQEAARDINAIERQLQRLNTASLSTPSKGASADMQRLKTQIDAAYQSFQKFAANRSTLNFKPKLDELNILLVRYRELIALENTAAKANTARALAAQEAAQKIISASEAERNASLRRQSSGFAFPGVGPNSNALAAAEDRLAVSTAKRLRLVNMIAEAQGRGAPLRSVERLNQLYQNLEKTMASDLALIKQINKEIANTPAERGKRINEYLFGDGGKAFSQRIAGAAIISTGVFAGINAIQSSLRFVVDFEAELKKLQAVSGSTDGQMVKLAGSITAVGRESIFSTMEITKAAQTIAQAGYAADELDTVLKGAITLSTASGSTPTEAVDTLTSALGAFRMQASDTESTVDSMVTALNRTKLTIGQVQLAIQYAGATAKENNVSFNELLTITASLAQAGIKSGSTIGTGLRQLLVDFKTPSEDLKKELKDLGLTLADIDVKGLGFAEVVRRLSSAGFDATSAYEGLEVRAAASFLAFKNQLPMYDELALAIAKGGAAAEAQARAMDSLGAQGTRLTNILGDLISTIADPFLDALKVIASGLAEFFTGIAEITRAFSDLTGSSEVATFAIRTLGFALLGLATGGPIGAVIGGLFGLISAIGGTTDAMDAQRTKTAEANAAYDSQTTKVMAVEDAINNLIERQASLEGNTSALAVETVNLGNQFQELQAQLGNTNISYNDLINTMIKFSVEQRRIQGELAATKKVEAEAEIKSTRDLLTSKAGSGRATARSELGSPLLATRYGRGYGDFRQRVEGAFGSNSQSTVRAAYNEAVDFNTKANNGIRRTVEALRERLDLLSQVDARQAEIALATRQIEAAAVTTGETYTKFEEATYGAQAGIASGMRANQEKAGSGDAQLEATVKSLDVELETLKKMALQFKATSQEWYAIQQLISQKEALKAKVRREARKGAEAEKKDKTPAYTGSPQADAKEAARFARSQGLRAGKVGPNGVSKGPGHAQNRAVDINAIDGVDANNAQAKAKLDKLALQYQKAGYSVLWNGKWYKPNGKIVPIPTKWGMHRDHLHVEAPELGITVGGQGTIGTAANTGEEAQERDEFNLRKAVASNRVGAAQAGISTILKQGKAGTFSPTDLQKRLDEQMLEYAQASLSKFDTDNPTTDLTSAALQQRSLARIELIKEISEKVAGFQADLNRAVADYAINLFEETQKNIERELESGIYNAEAPVRAAEILAERANSTLNRRSNADEGTQYYLNRRAEGARLSADSGTYDLRRAAEGKTQTAINELQATANLTPENQRDGQAYKDLIAQIAEKQHALNTEMQETDRLHASINARTQTFVALPLNQRLTEGVRAWAENNGVMDTYQDTLANNLTPALDMVNSGLTDMFSSLIQGKATLKQALASFISSIAQFVQQMIAKALALAAIKWFLQMIGVNIGSGPVGSSLGGGLGGVSPQMKGGPAGEPLKFMGGGSTSPYISQGVSNRDGVPAYLAQGEYVMRKDAVDSIGIPVMNAINRQGAKAIGGMGGTNVIAPAPKQETNIYLIKPEERPTLGKNDVLLTIQDDILQGGQTKALIRQVSQGG